ncbi:ferroxidase [Gloeophyllum trabeum ATCC 11539]|uniref:Ferroxidase n=1 Tax=Gloeophyllum trabeum (strain ATCC 11539 / FP-39264 / Madison 617) TaxID=670483 RepID=S7Q2U2_GLOTA|nr:ferroxidase [Gloeophyllum trabeum ATCC 11539]EPQ53867.1 ferroxidase [Gloeophyllum trabeum ATCC 11539]
MRTPLAAFAALTATTCARAAVHELWWNITYVYNAIPDGLAERRVIGVNGSWPPPPIEVSTNDTILLHALNSLDEVATLHHHGMFFNASTWMDGALGVSQCGIPPGASFDYVVPINGSGQWGTYWVHAHAKGQYVDGLRAPVVIHPPTEVYDYDDEYTIVLGDWYHDEQKVLLKQFISIANPGGAEPVPDSALVYYTHNGQYMGPIPGTTPSSWVTSNVGYNENATIPFERGKKYRLRIVNTSAFAGFYFWIDGHEMQIIEADGVDTQPQPVDMLNLAVAQRYSVLVYARNDSDSDAKNWAVHANMDTVMFDTVPDTLNPNVTSSISYTTPPASLAEITQLDPVDEYVDVNDTALVPVQAVPQLPPAAKTIELEVSFDTMQDGTNHAMFNLQTYNTPLVPAVFSELTLGENATVAGAYGPLSFVVDHLDVFDIVLKNGDAGKHPFHLHGHQFQLVGRATDYTSDNATLNPPLDEGQANPMRRDTVMVPSMGSATMRVVADNPGVWFFHCHIEWHLEVGLAIQIIEAPLEFQQRTLAAGGIPSYIGEQCAAQGMPTSGNAAGHASATDLSGLPEGPFPQHNGWHPKGVGAMFGCVLTAVIGMATVTWYSFGGNLTDEEVERETRERQAKKAERGRFFGLEKAVKARVQTS